jgi:hypothetical protein
MRWYWEGSHYQRAVGDAILDRVFGVDSERVEIPAHFGVLLTSSNIEEQLMRVRRDLDRYALTHQDQVRTLVELYAQTERPRAKLLSDDIRHLPVE